eukprot:TRINITY_DN6424_c0_g2_i1.p1 TRINITY_DN6424_c0_g2~~TRINITY_DN6424_c0_g2_i1.p1  ORF type:complete len:228 (+),score=80.65 TRINITY_DN6424_c0_g2_i1:260-943(+)
MHRACVVVAAAATVCSRGAAEAGPPFQSLAEMPEEDAWLALDRWSHVQVAEFVHHLAQHDFASLTLDGQRWMDKGVVGADLKHGLWQRMTAADAERWQFATEHEKYVYFGFPADEGAQREAVAGFQARVQSEDERRQDAVLKKRLAALYEGKRRRARHRLGLDEGELPEYADLAKWKQRKLKYFLEMWGAEAARSAERPELYAKAVQVYRQEAGKQGKTVPPDPTEL